MIAGGTFVSRIEKTDNPPAHIAVTDTTAVTDTAGSASDSSSRASSSLSTMTRAALAAFKGVVGPLSRNDALEKAFRGYYAFKSAHPDEVRKPYLYFVDFGLPSTTPRGYVFDMSSMRLVEGPFAVAHGRGSAANRTGIPTYFSNAARSMATSLGLYVAKATYAFHGSSGGGGYNSTGLRLAGMSEGFNDNAMSRGVVAHGAPYVTDTKAGRSEGCPAMEPSRAKRLLPKLANGGVVLLFAPNEKWLDKDPWVNAN